MPTYSKAKIADAVAASLGFDRRRSLQTVESMLRIMKDSLVAGEDILISGFGKFEVRQKEPRMGRNPATGERMRLDGRRVLVFRCSQKLRERINGG